MAAHTGTARAALIEAAYDALSDLGYAGATTAEICRRAGVGSGTFFHFFPTKPDVVVAVLAEGRDDARERNAALDERARTSADAALAEWARQTAADATDPRLAGFVAALSAMPAHPRITDELAELAAYDRAGLTAVVRSGARDAGWRTDISVERLTLLLLALADGAVTGGIERSHVAPLTAAEILDAARRLVSG